eukprot:813235_1
MADVITPLVEVLCDGDELEEGSSYTEFDDGNSIYSVCLHHSQMRMNPLLTNSGKNASEGSPQVDEAMNELSNVFGVMDIKYTKSSEIIQQTKKTVLTTRYNHCFHKSLNSNEDYGLMVLVLEKTNNTTGVNERTCDTKASTWNLTYFNPIQRNTVYNLKAKRN